MIQVIMLRNRFKRLGDPQPLPTVTEAEAHSYFQGWWAGLAIGGVCGVSIGVILAMVR